MPSGFTNDPEFNHPLPKPRTGWRKRSARAAAVLGILLFLIILFLPATRHSTGAMYRAQCTNNVKQIALALLQYEETYKALPPAHTVDASGRPLHSWRTLILPFLEQEPLYKSIDLSKPWNDPANAQALETKLSDFYCPTKRPMTTATRYLAIVGPNASFLSTKPRLLAEITDPHPSTLMVIEVGEENAVPWMAPVDADESLVLGLGSNTKVHHPGGMNAAFVDGSVHFIKTDVQAEIRRALISISGKDNKFIEQKY